jgi:hypothetical protein
MKFTTRTAIRSPNHRPPQKCYRGVDPNMVSNNPAFENRYGQLGSSTDHRESWVYRLTSVPQFHPFREAMLATRVKTIGTIIDEDAHAALNTAIVAAPYPVVIVVRVRLLRSASVSVLSMLLVAS